MADLVECPASSSHLTPVSPEKLLVFSSFTLSIAPERNTFLRMVVRLHEKTYALFSCDNFLFSERATDLFNSRIRWARLCLFHHLEIHMPSQMAPNTAQALREHPSLLKQKTGGSVSMSYKHNRNHKATEPRNRNSLKNHF